MSKIPHSRDTATARCPGCGSAIPFRRDRDCGCPWWCRACLSAMKRRRAA